MSCSRGMERIFLLLRFMKAGVAWQNSTAAVITLEGKEYILSTADKFLREVVDDCDNFLLSPPGAASRLQVLAHELIIKTTFLMKTKLYLLFPILLIDNKPALEYVLNL